MALARYVFPVPGGPISVSHEPRSETSVNFSANVCDIARVVRCRSVVALKFASVATTKRAGRAQNFLFLAIRSRFRSSAARSLRLRSWASCSSRHCRHGSLSGCPETRITSEVYAPCFGQHCSTRSRTGLFAVFVTGYNPSSSRGSAHCRRNQASCYQSALGVRRCRHERAE